MRACPMLPMWCNCVLSHVLTQAYNLAQELSVPVQLPLIVLGSPDAMAEAQAVQNQADVRRRRAERQEKSHECPPKDG